MASRVEKFGSATLEIEGQEIGVFEIEVEQFPVGDGHPKHTIVKFTAPREFPFQSSGQSEAYMAIMRPYSISGPSELPEDPSERIQALQALIRSHLLHVYGKK